MRTVHFKISHYFIQTNVYIITKLMKIINLLHKNLNNDYM